ncbi:acetyl-CoA carboxylase biotin carboxyl carrier protein subunit [Oscillibacter valericigenes]|uniref:acetyl-CoA carboxylase biotin carboxyl carrier protein n=1 Tax=Oscillibacter valericigenes TaxID=351091 RepID=UPI001F45B528|nr:biotin/lipoyl-containing protein [Oscillibacter valericigenes]MCF2617270.1 acetyl-CoA carboxylase biotin carboxyl carrier protein subunit [Oscillibacter valericigenes]
MTNQEIFDLMDRFQRSSIQTMKLSTQEFTIELSRGGVPASAAPVAAAAPAVPAPAPEANGKVVTAPLVGTFYAAPAPEKPPFVRAGDRVKKGDTLCLIEAMKMMSEIPAPCDCVIEAVLKESGELVSFGEPLLRYKPC